MLKHQNKNRDLKQYTPGNVIFAKNNRRDKRSAPFLKHTIHEDRGVTIITDKGKEIHKDNIRQ